MEIKKTFKTLIDDLKAHEFIGTVLKIALVQSTYGICQLADWMLRKLTQTWRSRNGKVIQPKIWVQLVLSPFELIFHKKIIHFLSNLQICFFSFFLLSLFLYAVVAPLKSGFFIIYVVCRCLGRQGMFIQVWCAALYKHTNNFC